MAEIVAHVMSVPYVITTATVPAWYAMTEPVWHQTVLMKYKMATKPTQTAAVPVILVHRIRTVESQMTVSARSVKTNIVSPHPVQTPFAMAQRQT